MSVLIKTQDVTVGGCPAPEGGRNRASGSQNWTLGEDTCVSRGRGKNITQTKVASGLCWDEYVQMLSASLAEGWGGASGLDRCQGMCSKSLFALKSHKASDCAGHLLSALMSGCPYDFSWV